MANGDPNMQSQVDKNCLTADILTYKCERMIDAANYMGITVDITRGTGMAGFREKLVKRETILPFRQRMRCMLCTLS